MNNNVWSYREEFPFTSRYFQTEAGSLHYVDEGDGNPVVFIHGYPAWSFTWRKLIGGLCCDHRCIAVDLIGFGLSEKPASWSYLPEAQARVIEKLLFHLGLSDVTLVVNGWGGPIGLSWAIHYPDLVNKIILLNTWMWPRQGRSGGSRLPLPGHGARYLLADILGLGSTRALLPAIGERPLFPRRIRRHYGGYPRTGVTKKAAAVLCSELQTGSPWLELMRRSLSRLRDKPAMMIWGMKDGISPQGSLDRWKEIFPYRRVIELGDTGHFPQEEKGTSLVLPVRNFLRYGLNA